jgi:hypothetical protein
MPEEFFFFPDFQNFAITTMINVKNGTIYLEQATHNVIKNI